MSSVSFCKFALSVPPMLDNAALYTPAAVQPPVVGAAEVPAISNDQVTEDILTVVDKLSDKFNETFQNITDPEVYARINNTLQQMDPGDLARIGAMLGGGLVGFRRAMAGDSPGAVLQGVTVGAALGAAGGYALPKILDSLVGAKVASLIKEGQGRFGWAVRSGRWLWDLGAGLWNRGRRLFGLAPKAAPKAMTKAMQEAATEAGEQGLTRGAGDIIRRMEVAHTHKVEIPSLPKLEVVAPGTQKSLVRRIAAPATGGAIVGYTANEALEGDLPPPGDWGGREGESSGKNSNGGTRGDSGKSSSDLPVFSSTDVKFMLGGFGLGSLLGFIYSRTRKKEDSEEESSDLVPTLIGGGLGTLAGLLAGKMFMNSAPQAANAATNA